MQKQKTFYVKKNNNLFCNFCFSQVEQDIRHEGIGENLSQSLFSYLNLLFMVCISWRGLVSAPSVIKQEAGSTLDSLPYYTTTQRQTIIHSVVYNHQLTIQPFLLAVGERPCSCRTKIEQTLAWCEVVWLPDIKIRIST